MSEVIHIAVTWAWVAAILSFGVGFLVGQYWSDRPKPGDAVPLTLLFAIPIIGILGLVGAVVDHARFIK